MADKMRYYQSAHTGKIFSEQRLSILNDIFWDQYIKDLIDMEFLKEVPCPNVIDVLRKDGRIAGTICYRDLHGCSLREAMQMTYKIMNDMVRYQKGAKNAE